MNKYKKLLKNTGFTALGTFGSKLLVFFFVRFYTAYLSTDEYSTSDLITQTAKLIMPLVVLGIVDAVFRFSMDKDYTPSAALSVGFYVYVFGALMLIPIGFALSLTKYFDGYVYLIILYVLASNLHSIVTYSLWGKDHYKFYGLQGIINTALVIILNILFLAVFHFGITGYVLSVILADFTTSLIIIIKEKMWRDIQPLSKVDKVLVKKMLRFSIPLMPTTILWWITSVSDRYIVAGYCGDSINGIYTVAYKIPTLLMLLCTVFIQAWNFSSLAENDEKERRDFFSSVFSSYSALMFVAGTFIIAFCELIKYVLFAPAYFSATLYIPILTIATVFSCLISFIGTIYNVKKKSILALTTSLVGAVLNVILNFVLVPSELFGIKMAGLGATGAAIATFVSYFVVFVYRAFTVKKVLPFDLKIPMLILNTLLLGAQVVIASIRPFGRQTIWIIPIDIIIQAPILIAITVINLRPLLRSIKTILTRKGSALPKE